MDNIYPATFEVNDDCSYTVTFPDLPGCITEGKTFPGAIQMAQKALTQWLQYLCDADKEIPKASMLAGLPNTEKQFSSLVCADVRDNRAVKRTISLPRWMDERATAAGLSLSRVLQDALEKIIE